MKGRLIMILTVDIGNTNITLSVYEKEKLLFSSRMFTLRQKSSDEYAAGLRDMLDLYGVSAQGFEGSVVSSVVPELTDSFIRALKKVTGTDSVVVGETHHGDFKVEILPVSAIGADLVSACVGAISKYPLPCLVADLGTATKILVIDEKGVFRGCTISPGVKISADALAKNTSLLPSVSLTEPERAIGTNTVECMQSGIVFGTAAMLDGMIDRIKAELSREEVTVIATGGYCKGIIPCCKTEIICDENLICDGLMEIYKKAKSE